MDSQIDGTIKVVVRARPLFENEKNTRGVNSIVLRFNGNDITLLNPKNGNSPRTNRLYEEFTYTFDKCFDSTSNNLEVLYVYVAIFFF
jgi:hypothetical protein